MTKITDNLYYDDLARTSVAEMMKLSYEELVTFLHLARNTRDEANAVAAWIGNVLHEKRCREIARGNGACKPPPPLNRMLHRQQLGALLRAADIKALGLDGWKDHQTLIVPLADPRLTAKEAEFLGKLGRALFRAGGDA